MSANRYSIVPHTYDLLTVTAPSFNRLDHHLVSATKRDNMIRCGEIELIEKSEPAIWRYTERKAATRGLSAKVGEYLAGAICAKQEWALVMRDEIRA